MPDYTCVIVCSGRKELEKKENDDLRKKLNTHVSILETVERPVPGAPQNKYPMVFWDENAVDGGNGGGGDANGSLIFIKGDDSVGAWDVRFHPNSCPPRGEPGGKECMFPLALRSELCLPMMSIDVARLMLAEGGTLNYLHKLFDYVALFPLSIPKEVLLQTMTNIGTTNESGVPRSTLNVNEKGEVSFFRHQSALIKAR